MSKLAAVVLCAGAVIVPAADIATAEGNSDAPKVCRAFAEAGVLERLGATLGECVNLAKFDFPPPSRDQSVALTAAYCGLTHAQADQEVTNKGQCIKVVHEYLATLES